MAKMLPSASWVKPEEFPESHDTEGRHFGRRACGSRRPWGWVKGVLLKGALALALTWQTTGCQAAPMEASAAGGHAASAAGSTAQVLPAASAASAAPAASAASQAGRVLPWRWQRVPRLHGRITARELGVIINEDDPYSVQVGEFYAHTREIPPQRVLRVRLPVQANLSEAELHRLRLQVDAFFDGSVQALALAWVEPWAVGCQSITAALSIGLTPDICRNTCARLSVSAYFNSGSAQPWRDHGIRPSMLLAAGDLASARRLIERGHTADGRLGRRGALPVHAYYMLTEDPHRSVRWRDFPPPGMLRPLAVQTHVQPGVLPVDAKEPIVLLQTGVHRFNGAERLNWAPGALADHLTSYGGQLTGGSGQTSALAWIDAGATASYGTVSEPCNHVQKFPHPQLLLLHYMQGASAIEAYWKSVRWPQQGLFIGDPLAAAFARDDGR